MMPGAQAAPPATPAQLAVAPGASAHAIGLYLDAYLLQQNLALQNWPGNPSPLGALLEATWVESSQDFPPGADAPAENALVQVPGIPDDDGALIKSIGAVTTMAGATGAPQAVASAQAVDVRLLAQAGIPTIQADVIRGQANADCVNDPNSTGTTFLGLSIAGQALPEIIPPNTEIDLQLVKIILNEIHPTADGRGIVVNALHIVGTSTGDPLLRGDVIIGHAVATVNCPNGKGSTGGDSDIVFTKDATPTTVGPGETVTYTATVQNQGESDCLVNTFIDHLPQAFEYVSTSGAFGTDATLVDRDGGGQDLRMGTGVVIAAGASAQQTIVLKVKADAVPGIYFNNLEIFCANLGNFAKGLDAPVEVTGAVESPSASPLPTQSTLPRTGGGAGAVPLAMAAAAVLGCAVLIRSAKPGRI